MSECIHGFEPDQCGTCLAAARRTGSSSTGTMVGQSFALIYAPELVPDTFVHLNVQGDSWKIRGYPSPDSPPVVIEQAGERSKRGALGELRDLRIELQESYPHSSSRLGESVENTRYWHGEIAKLNARHGIG